MSTAKKLLGQTAIYGLSSMLGRFSYFLLTPVQTGKLPPMEYGISTDIYVIIGILMVVLTFGMETAFFRHASKRNNNPDQIFSDAQWFVFATAIVFNILVITFQTPILQRLQYEDAPQYLWMLQIILTGELLVALPFARLRQREKAAKFAGIRLSGIGIMIFLNLYFFLWAPALANSGYSPPFSDGTPRVDHIFWANIISVIWVVVLFVPAYFKVRFTPSIPRIKTLLLYGSPLMIAGLAGIINELIDRQIIKYNLSLTELGLYGAVAKIAVFMALIIQSYRYAIEPFVFSKAEDKDSPQLYARIFDFLVLLLVIAMTGIAAGMDYIKFFIGSDYHQALFVVPWLLISQLLLGLIMHISIWYKVSDKTRFGIYLSGIGAVITIVLNILLLPRIGILGAAITNLFSHLIIIAFSLYWGQKRYYIPYKLGKNAVFLIIGSSMTFVFCGIEGYFLFKILVWLTFAFLLSYREKEVFLRILPIKKTSP
ncbi:MAG: oligosaccharide flippase family protein [Cryomorphaceae bacterium]|nr:oligosaccharide flippase family protein [Cryomorphaceae bacterium]